MKYSGEAKLSSGQRILEDMQAKLEECDTNTTDSRLKLERMDRILLNVKAGIEHLSDKLISLKLVRFFLLSSISLIFGHLNVCNSLCHTFKYLLTTYIILLRTNQAWYRHNIIIQKLS